MKKKLIFAIVVGIVVVIVWLLIRGDSDLTSVGKDGRQRRGMVKNPLKRLAARFDGGKTPARRDIDAAIENLKDRNKQAKPRIRFSSDVESTWTDEDGKPWPEKQRKLMRAVVDAAEKGDVAAVAAFAKQVAECNNPDLREQYVDELGWFGEQALVDLAPFIADPNEDVAEAARSQLMSAFQEIESDAEKAAIYTLMTRAVTDSDVLERFSDELFDMDEVIALQAIIDTLDTGTPKAQEAAKEAYKMITDEEWTDIDAAEAWLNENYVADDESLDKSKGAGEVESMGNGTLPREEGGTALKDSMGNVDEN